MSLLWIWLIVFVLYARTLNYCYSMDDKVRREGMYVDVPFVSPHPDFYKAKPSPWYRLFMIGMHCVNVSVIYMLWGWCPALLFAVHPLSVWGTAWVTGNYYATGTYFTLIAYYIITTFPNIWGAMVAMPIYLAAMHSCICPLTFPFMFLFFGITGATPWGLVFFAPLIQFLNCKRFRTGIKIRYDINNDKVLRDGSVKFSYLGRLALMTRLVGRYTFHALIPNKLFFFDGYMRRMKEQPAIWNKFHGFNRGFWASFALCVVVFAAGMMIHPLGIVWFFVCIAAHSQFNLTGQPFAQRYMYLSMVGMCVVLGTALQPFPILVAIVATLFIVRSNFFIPAWKTIEALWKNDVDENPNYAQSLNNLAQIYLGSPQPVWRLNEVGALLFKANAHEPDAWEIQMNIACWFSKMENAEETLGWTEKAIASLAPLGGIAAPLEMLVKQRDEIQKIIAHNNKVRAEEAAKAAEQGGAITSPPQSPGIPVEEGVKNDDARTEETKGIVESIGIAGA